MKTLAWALVIVLLGGLFVAEYAMDLTAADRWTLYVVFGAMALVTAILAGAALRWAPRLGSLLTSLRIVALAAVVVAGGAVAAAALTMFIEPHDLTLVLVALLLGVGLGAVLAVAVAGPLTSDLETLARTAEQIGAGNLKATTGITRNDELGVAAAAFDTMTARLAEAVEAEKAAERERSVLIAAVGHDLRTPLASLQAAVESLEDGVMGDNAGVYLKGMSTDIEHLRRLVDDLFLLAQIDAGRHRVEPEPVDLAELVDEAVEAMTPLSASVDVELTTTSSGPVPVLADPAAVGRILRNVIDNALRHGPSGSTVSVNVAPSSGGATVLIVDQGSGFPEEFRSKAFERFARANPARPSGGAGLGLAIAHELVALSHGSMEIPAGPGGRVQFWLPTHRPV